MRYCCVGIHRAARRHGVDDVAIRHVIDDALAIVDLEPDADPPKVLATGPDRAGNLLEVIWLELADDVDLVIRAMRLRTVFLRSAPDKFQGGHDMTDPTEHRTRSGRPLSDKDLEALATEVVEKDYDVGVLKPRGRGRPPMGSGPAEVVPVRIDPELLARIEARAEADHATTSEIIREAIRRFLDVA